MHKRNIVNFTSYLPEKVTKFLNSIHDITFVRKCPNFTLGLYVWRKNIFPGFFLWGRGHGNAPLPSPTPMAGPQAPHRLNPALYGALSPDSTSLGAPALRASAHRSGPSVLLHRCPQIFPMGCLAHPKILAWRPLCSKSSVFSYFEVFFYLPVFSDCKPSPISKVFF